MTPSSRGAPLATGRTRPGSRKSARSCCKKSSRAAQIRAARALAAVEAAFVDVAEARGAAAAARVEIAAAHDDIAALEATRTFRYTAGMRARYTRIRRLLGLN